MLARSSQLVVVVVVELVAVEAGMVVLVVVVVVGVVLVAVAVDAFTTSESVLAAHVSAGSEADVGAGISSTRVLINVPRSCCTSVFTTVILSESAIFTSST